MERLQKHHIIREINEKIILINGPKFVGKTTLANQIANDYGNVTYLDYDRLTDRRIIKEKTWLKSTDCLVLDELQKMSHWEHYVQDLFEQKPDSMKVIITSSSDLRYHSDIIKNMAGSVYLQRLLPMSIAEATQNQGSLNLQTLIQYSGFPEPLQQQDPQTVGKWRDHYLNTVIGRDVFDLEAIQNVSAILQLCASLQEKVGQTISYQTLADEIQISPTTAKKYVDLLEQLFIIFRVKPFSKGIDRSLLKEPKIYFYDTGLVEGDDQAQLENVVAVSLLKHVIAKQDCWSEPYRLQYLRTKEGKEVDFAIVIRDGIEQIIDVNCDLYKPSKHLSYFHQKYNIPAIQLVKILPIDHLAQPIPVVEAEEYLSGLYM